MLIKVEKGGEKYVSWAKKQLRNLERTRQDINLPVMRKFWHVAGSLIAIESSDFGDTIRITAPGGGGFLHMLYAKKIGGSDKFFLSARTPAKRPFTTASWESTGLGVDTYYSTGKPTVFGNTVRTPTTTSNTYLENGKSTVFGASGPNITIFMVFPHTYTVDGVPQTELLAMATNGGVHRLVGGVRTEQLQDGDQFPVVAGTCSADGRKLLVSSIFLDDTLQVTIDLSLPTPVSWTYITDAAPASPYGQKRVTSSDVVVQVSTPPDLSWTDDQSDTETIDATYPISRAVAGDITARLVRNNSNVYSEAGLIDVAGTIINVTEAQTRTHTESTIVTLQLPAGVSKEFVIGSLVHSYSANEFDSHNTVSGVHTSSGSGSWSAPYNEVSGSLSIIYADPTVPFVMYNYTSTSTVRTETGDHITSGGGSVTVFIDYDYTTTQSSVTGVLVGLKDIILHTTSTVTAGSSSDNLGGITGGAPGVINTSSDVTTDINDFSDLPNPAPAHARRVYWQGNDGALVELHAATTKDKDNWLVSRQSDLLAPGFDTRDYNLWTGTTATPFFRDDTTNYLTYLSASMGPSDYGPPIVLDPDAALVLSNPEQFEFLGTSFPRTTLTYF